MLIRSFLVLWVVQSTAALAAACDLVTLGKANTSMHATDSHCDDQQPRIQVTEPDHANGHCCEQPDHCRSMQCGMNVSLLSQPVAGEIPQLSTGLSLRLELSHPKPPVFTIFRPPISLLLG